MSNYSNHTGENRGEVVRSILNDHGQDVNNGNNNVAVGGTGNLCIARGCPQDKKRYNIVPTGYGTILFVLFVLFVGCCCCCFSHSCVLVANPKKTTLHGD